MPVKMNVFISWILLNYKSVIKHSVSIIHLNCYYSSGIAYKHKIKTQYSSKIYGFKCSPFLCFLCDTHDLTDNTSINSNKHKMMTKVTMAEDTAMITLKVIWHVKQ